MTAPSKNELKAKNLSKLLEIVAIMHGASSAILLGFSAISRDESTPTNLITGFLVAGLIAFFVTSFVIFFSYNKDKAEINYKYLRTAFFLSLGTQISS